jgi:hypothetical protein
MLTKKVIWKSLAGLPQFSACQHPAFGLSAGGAVSFGWLI